MAVRIVFIICNRLIAASRIGMAGAALRRVGMGCICGFK
jgi:hypothetical protein